jgi:hypothetical protein
VDLYNRSCGSASEWGGISSCSTGIIPYGEDTVIRYWIEAQDRAGNMMMTGLLYVSAHSIVNFVVHNVYMAIGTSFDLDVQVRNLQPAFDNVTLMITGFPGYVTAVFIDTGVGNLTGSGYVLEDIGLNPNEEKMVKIRVTPHRTGPEPGEDIYVYLNATSMLNATAGLCGTQPGGSGECMKDGDEAMIVVGYPASFPEMSAWAILLLVVLSAVIYSGLMIRS